MFHVPLDLLSVRIHLEPPINSPHPAPPPPSHKTHTHTTLHTHIWQQVHITPVTLKPSQIKTSYSSPLEKMCCTIGRKRPTFNNLEKVYASYQWGFIKEGWLCRKKQGQDDIPGSYGDLISLTHRRCNELFPPLSLTLFLNFWIRYCIAAEPSLQTGEECLIFAVTCAVCLRMHRNDW